MKSLDVYKDAVLKRAEEKRREQRRNRRRALAVCVPLFVCVGILGTTALRPLWNVSEDMNGGASPEVTDGLSATVVCKDTTVVVDDAAALYEAVLGLYDSVGGADGTTGDTGDLNCSPESVPDQEFGDLYYESDDEPSASPPCYLHFTDANSTHSFLLQDGMLTDLASGARVPVTNDQAYALINGAVPPIIVSKLDAVQWFPCRKGYENDDLWEVQCDDEYYLFQRFDETAEDTGYNSLLDITYADDGSLTITRNDVEGSSEARIQTILIENTPALNLTNGNVLHIDFEANVAWSIALTFDCAHTVVLDEAIARACGRSLENGNGSSGRYTTALDLHDVLQTIAASDSDSTEAAAAVLEMESVPTPQLTITCIGEQGRSLTMHKWLYSSPTDPNGEQCRFANLDLLCHGIIYETSF